MRQFRSMSARELLLPLVLSLGILACGALMNPGLGSTSSTAIPESSSAGNAGAMPTPVFTTAPGGVLYTGRGDSVVEVHKTNGAALVHISYGATTPFEVWPYDSAGDRLPMLVQTVGHYYEGTRPLDFELGTTTASFHVTGRGPWAIEILPFGQIKTFAIPAGISGNGDDVVLLEKVTRSVLLKIEAGHAAGNFIIWAYGDRATLLVNDFAPYSKTITFDKSLASALQQVVLAIQTTGKWSIQVDVQ